MIAFFINRYYENITERVKKRMDITKIVLGYVVSIGWALVAAISMSLSMGILLKVYDMMTPIDEWEEIRKGNIACGIIMASVVLAFGIVVAFAIAAPDSLTLITKTAP